MKIINIIENKLNKIISLGYEPVNILIDESLYDKFVDECKEYIVIKNSDLKSKIVKFKGFDVMRVDLSNIRFSFSDGAIFPIQITVKN